MAKPRKRTESATGVENPGQSPETPVGTIGSQFNGRDRIAVRAYELYLARGGGDGRDFDDWIEAERELAAEVAASEEDSGE